jgi:thiosulfate/3-mercaptopyruvate sulfurtransferase
VNIEDKLTLNPDGTLKSFQELQTLYKTQGVIPTQQIFTYCAIGARSAYVCFVLKYLLGYNHVRNYDGSWNEWSRLPNAAIEK